MAARIALLAAGALISGFTIRRGIEPFDEGLTLQAARRVADGQLPYRDFLWAYGPAHPYLLAGLFKALGTSLLWWRLIRVAVDAAIALTVWAIVRREVSPRWALAAWATAAFAMAQPTGANPFAPALLFGLLAVLGASRERWVLAGLLAGAAAAWRLDFGVYAALAAIAAAHVSRRGMAIVATACAGLTALVYLPFVIALGPADAWDELIGHSLREGSYWRLPFPFGYDGGLRLWGPGSLAHDVKDVLGFYVPLLGLVAVAIAVIVLVVRRPPLSGAIAGSGVLALCSVAYLLSRTDEFHATPLIVALAVLVPVLLARAGRLALPLALILTLLFAHGALNRASALFDPPELASLDVPVADGVRAPPDEARAIESMVAAVQRRVPAGEPIYTVTRRSDLVRINDPLVYVLAERDNPTRQDFGLQTGAAAQRAIVTTLERARPRVVVRWLDPVSTVREPNRRGRPTGVRTLDRWLAQRYRPAERFGDYELLVPRG